MKTSTLKIAFLTLSFALLTNAVSAQVAITGASGITDGTSYTTLKGAFDAINAQTNQSGKNIVVTISASTTETTTASLTGTATNSWNSLKIYPVNTGVTISGNIDLPLIKLNGADNVTIDGRVNATGSTKSLTITNSSTGATSATTLQFESSAENNIVKYCTLKGSETSTSKGVVFFSTSASGNGNDNNLIDNNNITSDAAGRPVNAIYSLGASGYDNSGITISNNNIYDFLKTGTASNAINIFAYNTTWSITGNSFYETTSFIPTATVPYSIILINNSTGTGFNISDNYIGGSAASCGGTWNKSAAYDNVFYGINLNVGTAVVSSIQNNTIKNFSWSNSAAATWTGMQITVGAVNIGTVTANTIGASTGTGAITVTGGTSGATVYGINIAGSGTINIQNNNIGSITAANSDGALASNLYGIYRSNTGVTNISANNIGSTSDANSIQASSASTANAQTVYGIYNSTGGTITINNNLIANLSNSTTNSTTATAGLINGIASTLGVITVTNNTVRNLTIANANNASNHTASVCGITLTSTNSLNTISGNTICNLSNTNATYDGIVMGMYFAATGSSHIVSSNFIHSLSVNAATTSASIYGIKIYTGATTYSNNIISLGGNTTSSLYGIYETGAASNNNSLYFNTIYLSGAPVSGSLNSYALYSAASTNTRNFRNNLLFNARSNNGASGKHYGVYFNYGVNTSLTLDYNDYSVTGTGGVLGYYNGADVSSLPIITTFDANSMTTNPTLASAGGTVAANYKPTSDKLGGFQISTVSTDYAALNRAASPTIGAYEVTQNLNVDVYKSGVFQASYFRIKDAFDKINSGAHTGALELKVKANTTETLSAVLYQSGYTGAGGTSNFTSVKIYPTVSGITISGSLDASLIDLNGADSVIIDGRVNRTGLIDMTIVNSSVSTYASTIRLANSAENNTIRYCKVNSSCNNSGVGCIYFASSAAGNGNDNNIVEFCNLSNAGGNRPANVIFSSGGTSHENSGIIIRNNNIFDFLSPNFSSYGINISYNSTDWIVSDNSFYQTSTLVPTGILADNIIRVNTGNNHLISNNYIGGSEPLCAGAPWTTTASTPHYLCGFYINGGTGCTVQNNTLKNMDFTSVEDNPWDGAFINTGNVNFTGNTIGSTTGTGSIKLRTPLPVATTTITGGVVTAINLLYGGSGYTTAPTVSFATSTTTATAIAIINGSGVLTGFNLISGGSGYATAPAVVFDGQSNNYSTSHPILIASPGTIIINNNNVGSITTYGSDYYSHGLENLYVRSNATDVTITNNLFGSLSTANSLQASSSCVSSLQKQDIYGIYSSGIGTATISGNTVCNLYNAYAGINSASRARGISTITGSNTISNNVVKYITTASGQSSSASSASIIGISQSSNTAGTTQTISGNTVSNLSNTHANASVVVSGIYNSGPVAGTQTITGNFVHSISLATSNINGEIDGIVLFSGLTTTANNIINLGTGITAGYKVYGIWDDGGATNNNNVYFNTVYVGGTVAGTTSVTAALYNKLSTNTSRDYRNNLLVNLRSGGTTNSNYAIYLAGTAGLTCDYNNYYVTGSLAKVGKIGNFDKVDLAAWKLGTSQDVNSLSINPGFTNAGSTTALDYLTSATMPGIGIAAVTTDYSVAGRAITPKMGAYEGTIFTWQGATSSVYGTGSNWAGGAVPPDGADITFAVSPNNHCVLDQNRVVKKITNAQAAKNLVLNGKQLTVTGDFAFTNSAKIDATASASKIVFAGTAAQSIPAGSFVSNTVDSLAINNANGLALNGDFTINKGIALVAGNFAIGANTLTFNGIVTAMTGTVTGGTSTNMIIGGTSSTISMPAFTLGNLTINRASGVNLYGNLNIVNGLTLTNGTLTVGANTLTISGSSPTRTTGSIDASNVAASLVFTNTSAVTLPASIFSAAVNNLTISGAGGVTSSGDFGVNGILNLSASNPSAIKGLLDMWDGAAAKTLTMAANATTVGAGDVTGIINRTSFVLNTPYTFGNQFTTVNFSVAPLPTSVSIKPLLTATHTWKSTAINRYYDIIRSGSDVATRLTLNLHYLDSELNGLTETNLDFFDYHVGITTVHDHGHSNKSTTDNWLGLSNLGLTFLGSDTWGAHYWTLAANETSGSCTWIGGSPSGQTDWTIPGNWSGGVPVDTSRVIIPDVTYDPVLPVSTSIGTLSIQSGGVVNTSAETASLTITGGVNAWDNLGTFNAGTSTVIFTNAAATMSDPTNFYNVTVANGANLSLGTNNIMRIAGTLSLSSTGVLNAANNHNTIEYNGADQTIINPNGATIGYHNLILSGSGTKTMPGTALSVLGDLSSSGTASATAASAITLAGNIVIGTGTTFNSGNYNHSVAGNFENDGTFNAASGYGVTMNGAVAQTIGGTSTTNFDKLTINNSTGVSLLANENVTNVLTLTAGNLMVGSTTLGINGTISKTSGLLDVTSLSSLSFGGSSTLTITNGLFTNTPSINNLTINRSGGVTLGNQSITVNGLLELPNGTLTLAANTLTLAGSSPTRTSGNIDASNAAAIIVFANTSAIVLPASIFTGNVNNFTISNAGTGGVTAGSDFTIDGVLSLQSVNPSDTKGSLEMTNSYGTYPGTTKTSYLDSHILTMGSMATTIGIGDVTGTVKRNAIVQNTSYSFGNQFTTLSLTAGTMPTALSVTITIGTSVPAVDVADVIRDGVKRTYEIVPAVPNGYSSTSTVNANFHYLDSELTSSNSTYHVNTENKMVTMDYDIEGAALSDEHGRSTYDFVNNYIGLSNVPIAYFINIAGHAWRTIFTLRDYVTDHYTWNGSQSSVWGTSLNWSPTGVPSDLTHVIIPDISTTLYQCVLAPNVTINTMTIENGGAMTMGNETITIKNSLSGGWEDQNALGNNPGTSKVLFSMPGATLSGTSRFYDVEIGNGADITNQTGSTMKIANTLTRTGTGKWYADVYGATIEYNGAAQTVALPDGTPHYHNLSLSGSGVKTLPVAPLSLHGNLSLQGTASTSITDVVTAGGNLSLASGTSLTVSPTKMLDIAGAISNNAGTSGLVVKSSSTMANGTLIYHNAYNAPVSATVEMYSKAFYSTAYKWQFFGIPIRTMTAFPTFNGGYVRQYNEAGIGSGLTADKHWIQLQNGSTLTSFKGYEAGQAAAKTFYFTGELVNSDYASGKLPFTATAQYTGQHLIGNPYTAAIDISKIEFGTTDTLIIQNTIYLYNTGSYSDWTNAGSGTALNIESTTPGQYISIPKFAAGVNGLPTQIPSMQAFLVMVASDNALATVSIPYSAAGTVLKNTTLQRTAAAPKVSTRIQVKGSGFGDNVWLITEPSCNRGFDNGWDGYKSLYSGVTQIFAMETSGDYQVNSVADINNTYLGFQAGTSEIYTMTFTHENMESQYPALYLIDLMNNSKVTDITLSGSTYSFTANATGTPDKRFKIVTSLGVATDIQNVNGKKLKVYSSNNTLFVQNMTDLKGDIDICDLTAKVLQKSSFNANEITSLPINVPAGAYIVKATVGFEIVTQSVIVK